MFEFLVEEMARIKTRKFHLVDGPASPEFQAAVESSGFPVPSSYKRFVLQFGNAKLYRRVDHYNSYYWVEVFGAPREVVTKDGERLLQFGRTHTSSTQMSLAYFKDSPILQDEETAVFEWRHGQGVRKTADGFLNGWRRNAPSHGSNTRRANGKPSRTGHRRLPRKSKRWWRPGSDFDGRLLA